VELSLLEIITALGGPLLDPEHCQKYAGKLDTCVHNGNCSVHEILDGLAGYLSTILSRTTLQDLVHAPTQSGKGSGLLKEIYRAPFLTAALDQHVNDTANVATKTK
jgi:DNA-binding IscR family transcriptional regulator